MRPPVAASKPALNGSFTVDIGAVAHCLSRAPFPPLLAGGRPREGNELMKLPVKTLAAAGALMVISAGAGFSVAQVYQPHMQNALGYLQSARTELAVALPDKGGHRVAALSLVNQAISQVHQGINYAY
jgi:hypothetical protein